MVITHADESLGLQGDPTGPFWRRSVLGVHWRTDAKAEIPGLWPPHVKSWLTGKDSDAGRDWGQEEKGTTEDGIAGWHHWLTRWTWVWVNSGSWWWTGRPGVLRFMGSQRVGHDWGDWTELTELILSCWDWFNSLDYSPSYAVTPPLVASAPFKKSLYWI